MQELYTDKNEYFEINFRFESLSQVFFLWNINFESLAGDNNKPCMH